MKQITLLVGAIFFGAFGILSQLPLPCTQYHSGNTNQFLDLDGFSYRRCIEFNWSSDPLLLTDDQSRHFEVRSGEIKPGFAYTPENAGELSITLGEGSELEGAWIHPAETYYVPLYTRAEWGVRLSEEVEQAIDNWIINDQTGSQLTPAINPFDPEQLDVWAEAGYNGSPHRINGFFYQSFERDMTNADKNYWNWEELENEYRFRIRFSPTVQSEHLAQIHVNAPGYGTREMMPFTFDVDWNDPSKSFVKVSPNKHYFVTDDGNLYFPIGLNINDLIFGCECEFGNPQEDVDCDECYLKGENDWCCGLDYSYKKARFNGDGNYQLGNELREVSLPMASYLKLHETMEELVAEGGNSMRYFTDPLYSDVEFEKLNNYYDRQYQAWECDQMLDKCAELDMRILWNQMIHYGLTYKDLGCQRWDWSNEGQCNRESDPNDPGCAYLNELGILSPVGFLEEPAISFYKKKLRYMLARWGYSPSIYLIELVSEINTIGAGQWWDCDDANENGIWEPWPHWEPGANPLTDPPTLAPETHTVIGIPKPYENNENQIRTKVAEWHHEMAGFIHTDDGDDRHLVSTSYAGMAPRRGNVNVECHDPLRDWSWESPFIDVIDFNFYSAYLDKYKSSSSEYTDLSCQSSLQPYSNIYNAIGKPVAYGESGIGDVEDLSFTIGDCDVEHTGIIKDMLSTFFTGHASSGHAWIGARTRPSWHYMGKIQQFLNEHVMDDLDLVNESWIPEYQTTPGGNQGSRRAECVYLRFNDQENPRYFGIINNMTWNYYTLGETPCNGEEIYTYLISGEYPEEDHDYYRMNHTVVGWHNEKLRLPHSGMRNWQIKYFDVFSGIELNSESNFSEFGTLDLQNYPLLADFSSGFKPFCFFLAYPQIEGWPTRMTYSDSSYNLQSVNANVVEIQSEHSRPNDIDINIYPNPASGFFHLETSLELMNSVYFIEDPIGHILCSNIISQSVMLLELNLCAGTYFLHIPEFNLTRKIILAP